MRRITPLWLVGAMILLAAALLILKSGTRSDSPVRQTGPASHQTPAAVQPSSPPAAPAKAAHRESPEKPPSPECEAQLRQGLAALQGRNMATAARAFERAVEADPNSGLARDYLGIADLKQHRLAEALHQFQEEVRLEPDHPTGWARLSDVYVSQGNLQAAAKAMQKAVALAPDMAQLHFNLAVLYQQTAELSKGVDEFRRSIALEPQNDNAHYLLGKLLYQLARLDEAEQELNEAIRLQPQSGTYHFALAQVYLKRDATAQNTEHARAELERALELGVDTPGAAHYNLGLCYKRLGRLDAALKELQISVKLAPEAIPAYYELQDVLQQLGRTAEARRAQARFVTLRAKADAARQRSFYTQEVARNPDSPDARYQLAEYLAESGNRAQARLELERARQLARSGHGAPNLQQRISALKAKLGN